MSISKVDSSQPIDQSPLNTSNMKSLVLQFRDQIASAKEYNNPDFVTKVAQTIKTLYETSAGPKTGSSELMNNLHAMLNAPLLLESGDEMSLYQASQTIPHEALTQILKMHVHLPASTELLINELNELAQDL
ncbi:MAG: hypothetical protein KBC64_03850 [Simkaniaceae bacterium]|nr:hypothetical protein [Simkaniaceae bacterium]